MNKTQRLTRLALTVAVAMLLSFIESRIPPLAAVPGVKIGLANIAVMLALYRFGAKEAVLISLTRVVLISLLFGNLISMLYGICGGTLSLCLMLILKRFTPLSPLGVSVAGGVAHNVGQIALACLMLETSALAYYLPVLILSGTLSGIAIGICASVIIKRLPL